MSLIIFARYAVDTTHKEIRGASVYGHIRYQFIGAKSKLYELATTCRKHHHGPEIYFYLAQHS